MGKIKESMHCRMLLKGYGGWHIQTGSFRLLNLSSGRTWVGKGQILRQILGEYNLWSFKEIIILHFLIAPLLIFSNVLYSCRGGGFVSLENLIFFAQNYPVCFLFPCNIFSLQLFDSIMPLYDDFLIIHHSLKFYLPFYVRYLIPCNKSKYVTIVALKVVASWTMK